MSRVPVRRLTTTSSRPNHPQPSTEYVPWLTTKGSQRQCEQLHSRIALCSTSTLPYSMRWRRTTTPPQLTPSQMPRCRLLSPRCVPCHATDLMSLVRMYGRPRRHSSCSQPTPRRKPTNSGAEHVQSMRCMPACPDPMLATPPPPPGNHSNDRAAP